MKILENNNFIEVTCPKCASKLGVHLADITYYEIGTAAFQASCGACGSRIAISETIMPRSWVSALVSRLKEYRMGAWSESIMGGDTPLDIKFLFEEAFGEGVPSPKDAVAFVHKAATQLGAQDAAPYVTAFIMIERGAPINDELRKLALEGLELEMCDGARDWSDPAKRMAELCNFYAIVEAYPNEGKRIELPHQPGLMETIAEKFHG